MNDDVIVVQTVTVIIQPTPPGFAPGWYQLYACAIDTYNARTCSFVNVEVNEPALENALQLQQLVQNCVAKIDVLQLASTGDVSAVTAALHELASIASFAAGATIKDFSGTGILDSKSTAANMVHDATVVAMRNDLLTTLSYVIDSRDAASMSVTLNVVGAVSNSAIGLTAAAGAAMLDVVDGFVAANKELKTTDISDAQFCRLSEKI
eukprot:gene1480-1821_t